MVFEKNDTAHGHASTLTSVETCKAIAYTTKLLFLLPHNCSTTLLLLELLRELEGVQLRFQHALETIAHTLRISH